MADERDLDWDVARKFVPKVLSAPVGAEFPRSFVTEPPPGLRKFQTAASKELGHLLNGDDFSLPKYYNKFKASPEVFDLHDRNFQDYAIRTVQALAREGMDGGRDGDGPIPFDVLSLRMKKMGLESQAHRRLVRAYVYAVCSRSDLDWEGYPARDDAAVAKKEEYFASTWKECRLYNWWSDDAQTLAEVIDELKLPAQEQGSSQGLGCPVQVMEDNTQACVEKCADMHPDSRIAWLNMANAHKCGGNYDIHWGGSQEEGTATACDGIVQLGRFSEREGVSGLAQWVKQIDAAVVYKSGYHIPPGGAIFCPTKFVTSDPQVDCFMIATAFCDLRRKAPMLTPYSEFSDYFSITGSVRNEGKLSQRLAMDMIGILMTAMHTKMDVLVLGAGGCGAFKHDPVREAKLWRVVLEGLTKFCSSKSVKFPFRAVYFGILPDKNNLPAFKKEFP